MVTVAVVGGVTLRRAARRGSLPWLGIALGWVVGLLPIALALGWAENEAATLSRVITEPVPLLFQVSSQVSKEVSGVVMRSLDRDRDKRFPSCAAFADALEAAAALKDKVATPRELAAYVNEVMGQEIAQQRDNVRTWLAHSEPIGAAPGELLPGAIPSSSVSAAAISLPGYLEGSHSGVSGSLSSVQQPKRSRVPLVLGSLLLIALLGGGGFMLTRSARSVGAAAGTPPTEPSAAPAVTPSAAAPPEPSGLLPSAAASAELPPPTAASALGTVPPPRPATHAPPAPPRPRRKKPSDDVDLRNPYR
jgi:serine/threonine-protein kinase